MKLSSIGKKIIVFSDVHNEIIKTKKIIEKENADYNICLGDWFDSFHLDNTYHYRITAEYLVNEFLPKQNNISLFGNHDLHYFFKNQFTMCSGFERRKHEAISEIINYSFVDKFKWYIWIDNYLCTHAGLHPNFIDPTCKNNEDIDVFLQKESERADSALIAQHEHWFYGAGFSRGGKYRQGGIVWLDFNDEFECVENLNQIVGHTNQRNGTCSVLINDNSDNICIDCFQNQYLVIQDEKINIKKFVDL
jgi:hypothetical protein